MRANMGVVFSARDNKPVCGTERRKGWEMKNKTHSSTTEFNINSFVECVEKELKKKQDEYQVAYFKGVTRYEEKFQFFKEIVFPAMNKCHESADQKNVQAFVDVIKEGAEKFTTFGFGGENGQSGISRIFESMYFACTDGNGVAKKDMGETFFQMNEKTKQYHPDKKSATDIVMTVISHT